VQRRAIFELLGLSGATAALLNCRHWCSIRVMRSGARIGLGIASVLAAAVNFTACGSTSHDSMVSGGAAASTGAGTGTGGSNGAAASSSGGALSLNTGGSMSGIGVGIGVGGADESCAADVSTGKLIPLDMYIMLDTSGSMLDATAAKVSKWTAIKSALETFLKDDSSAGLGVGLQYFPLMKADAPKSCTTDASCGNDGPCFSAFCQGDLVNGDEILPCDTAQDCPNVRVGRKQVTGGPCVPLTQCSLNANYICPAPNAPCEPDALGNDLGMCELAPQYSCLNATSCDVTQYAAPAQAIATLPASATALLASIDATTPNGETPTAPALTGAIQQASAWAKAHPDHRVVAVMATDGLPTECMPTDINQVGAIAAQGVAATPSIDTFVIGVFGPTDVADGAPGNLDTIAKDGGTTSAFIVDTTKDVTAQFVAALDAIRGGKLDCDFQIPQPKGGQTLDYSQVNVQVSITGQPDTLLYYVGSVDKCDATTGGWYYDTDPSVTPPTKIIACPKSCTAFQASNDASVQIALGCQTVVK
jgi:hypothetical protein